MRAKIEEDMKVYQAYYGDKNKKADLGRDTFTNQYMLENATSDDFLNHVTQNVPLDKLK